MAGRFCCAAKAGNRHADHDGVVARQRDVDHDNLRQRGEVGGQCDLVQAFRPPLVNHRCNDV